MRDIRRLIVEQTKINATVTPEGFFLFIQNKFINVRYYAATQDQQSSFSGALSLALCCTRKFYAYFAFTFSLVM
jgi:hypothetical protein